MNKPDPTRDGYWAAVAGTLLGAVISAAVAYLAVTLWVRLRGPEDSHGLGALILIPLAGIGMWLGSTLGCWAMLRLRRHALAERTARLLMPLMLASTFLSGILFIFSSLTPIPPELTLAVVFIIVPGGVAVMARRNALKR